MQKPAETTFPIHEHLRRRWSPLAFDSRPVPPQIVGSLLEAARWAPSCFGEEPWAFLIATAEQPEEHARLAQCLVDGNRVWAEKAPVLLIALAKLHFERNGKPNAHAWHDVGLAMSQLTVQAMDHGLRVHQMGGILPDKIREEYGIPEGWQPITGAAIGYQGDPSSLPDEKLREREMTPRRRRALQDFVFTGTFGKTAPLLSQSAD